MTSKEAGLEISRALAIASVTALLKDLLENGLVHHGVMEHIGSDVPISALPPDHISMGADERPHLNLFLYQVTMKTGLRTLSHSATAHPDRPPTLPLSFDLYYLITAYGAQDYQIEMLLGYTMELLYKTPVLDRETIQSRLRALSSPENRHGSSPTLKALMTSNLAELVSQITLSPQSPTSEEMSRLWSALQVRYRLSIVYKVSMVLAAEAP